ncbi:lysozyme [Formicincola oecophyllae]|uniref:Lysozyme n=1 Tax=Formicincola oecophyllae TaxID=2558361 RepID=A0A4Y6U9J2_9PROT|nr:lysozyme [Formicincola oecophyllae]QDH14143.1 lysozyme [Formicincola oecophyllae]
MLPPPENDLRPAVVQACALARQFEGFRSHPYKDSGGVWTIGYGFTHLPAGSSAPRPLGTTNQGRQVPVTAATPPLTPAQADPILHTMMGGIAHQIWHESAGKLQDSALAALADFAFNMGLHALLHSTLWRLLMAGHESQARAQLGRWVHGKGSAKPLPGLVRRRAAEAALWAGQPSTAH